MTSVDEPLCPITGVSREGERRVPSVIDFDLANSGTVARVSEESGLVVAGARTGPRWAHQATRLHVDA